MSTADTYREWRDALDAAAVIRKSIIGQHVTFAGQHAGTVVDMTASGIKVRMNGTGKVELLHPSDVEFTPARI